MKVVNTFIVWDKGTIQYVSNQFYCELDGNWAHLRCKEQCNHCKEEFKKMINQ